MLQEIVTQWPLKENAQKPRHCLILRACKWTFGKNYEFGHSCFELTAM
jgi:hypothetical protein